MIEEKVLKRLPITLALTSLLAMSAGATLCAQQAATASPVRRPFSPGLQVGDTLYVSGHLGLDPAVGKPSGDTTEEAEAVLHSVEATLKEAGMTMDDLVYIEVYCTDLKLYDTFNKAYTGFFHAPYPARDFIGAKELLFGAHYEVMGIAVRNGASKKKVATVGK